MKILLTKKHQVEFSVDDTDFQTVSSKTWCICHYGYPVTTIGDNIMTLHVLLIGKPPAGYEWDHIDRNKLNNTRSNLRLVDRVGNSRNKNPQSNNTSGVSGVGYRRSIRKWRARIKVRGKEIFLGDYDTIHEAVNARKQGELQFWSSET